MSTYAETIKEMEASCGQSSNWSDISPEYAARMRLQNRFKTGLDIARYTAAIMRKDMADYDSDPATTPSPLDVGMASLASKSSCPSRNTSETPISVTCIFQVG